MSAEYFIESSVCTERRLIKGSDSGDADRGPTGDDNGLGSPIWQEVVSFCSANIPLLPR